MKRGPIKQFLQEFGHSLPDEALDWFLGELSRRRAFVAKHIELIYEKDFKPVILERKIANLPYLEAPELARAEMDKYKRAYHYIDSCEDIIRAIKRDPKVIESEGEPSARFSILRDVGLETSIQGSDGDRERGS